MRTRVSTCGDVHRLLLLEDARLHAVVADAMARPGTHRVVDRDDAQRGDELAHLPHRVHLADLLLERAAGESHAERVLLQRPGLGVLETLAARVLVAIVAEHAVVDLLLDVACRHAPVGQRETEALAPLVVRTDEELGERGIGPIHFDQVRVVE